MAIMRNVLTPKLQREICHQFKRCYQVLIPRNTGSCIEGNIQLRRHRENILVADFHHISTNVLLSSSLRTMGAPLIATAYNLSLHKKEITSCMHRKALHTSGRMCVMEDKETKALTVWSNLRQVKASPLPALTLGLGGLVPFVSAPVYLISSGVFMPEIAFAQVAYGASILSFLGGVRWGLTLPEENPIQPDWTNLTYSVLPSLVAWTGLLLPSPWCGLTVMGGLVFTAYYDMAMYGYPAWFKGLRFILSFVAVLSLWSTFMCSFMLKDRKQTENEPT